MTALTEEQILICRRFGQDQRSKVIKVATVGDLSLEDWLKEIDRLVADYLSLKEQLVLTRA